MECVKLTVQNRGAKQDPVRARRTTYDLVRRRLLKVPTAAASVSSSTLAHFSIITMAPSKLPPSAVKKECQRVIHFIAHNEVLKMEDLNNEQMKNELFTLVLGDATDDNQLSLNALFLVGGKQQFAHEFDRETINVTEEDASTNKFLF